MKNLHPKRVLTTVAMFLATLAIGGVAVQMTNPEPGFARDVGVLPALAPVAHDGGANTLPASGTFAPVVEAVAPAVVSITAEGTVEAMPQGQLPFFFAPGLQRGPRNSEPQKQRGAGSGVILKSDGLVVTNHHVIDGAGEITVHLSDKRQFKAELVGTDPHSDIALLRIEADGLPTMPLGNSENVEVGDIVLAMGNPFGIGQTVTMGIVGATGRGGLGIERYENFIQTDAAINPGNSGGALVNSRGELIGINTAIIARGGGGNQGVGFAVPINMAHHVMKQLASNGHVSRGYMGVGIQEVDQDIAAAFGVKPNSGALITNVEPGSPADEAGLAQGDIIQEVNGIDVDDPRALSLKVAEQAPGSEVELAILRDGAAKTVAVKLAEHPEFGGQPVINNKSEPTAMGISVQSLTPELAEQLELDTGTTGVVVARVNPAGPASEAGLQRGDVIEQVDRQSITSPAEFEAAVAAAGDKPVLMLVNRRGNTRFIVVKR